jgi:hypothetical protein
VAGDTLDQRVLNTCITQIVDERVAEAFSGRVTEGACITLTIRS